MILRCHACRTPLSFSTNLICADCHPELAERFALTDEAALEPLGRFKVPESDPVSIHFTSKKDSS